VFQGEGYVEFFVVRPVFPADDEHFVRRRFEGLCHDAEGYSAFIHGLEAYQISHVNFVLFRLVEIRTVEDEILALQGIRVGTARKAFEVHEKPFGSFARAKDAAPDAIDNGFDAFPQVATGARGPHADGATYAMGGTYYPDDDRVEEIFHGR